MYPNNFSPYLDMYFKSDDIYRTMLALGAFLLEIYGYMMIQVFVMANNIINKNNNLNCSGEQITSTVLMPSKNSYQLVLPTLIFYCPNYLPTTAFLNASSMPRIPAVPYSFMLLPKLSIAINAPLLSATVPLPPPPISTPAYAP